MKIISLKCPDCGASLHIEEGHKMVYCAYCGSRFFMDDENRTYTINIRDEAEIKRVEMERQRYIDEREDKERSTREFRKKQRRWFISLILVVIIEAIAIAALIQIKGSNQSVPAMLTNATIALIFTVTRPKKISSSNSGFLWGIFFYFLLYSIGLFVSELLGIYMYKVFKSFF